MLQTASSGFGATNPRTYTRTQLADDPPRRSAVALILCLATVLSIDPGQPIKMVLRSKPTLVLPPTLQHQMLEGDVDYWPALRAWLERSGRRDVNGTVDEYGRTLLFYAANAGSLVVRRRAVAKDALLARLVRLPNSTVWHVLTYWRGDRLPAV